jgi:hypothetical protein
MRRNRSKRSSGHILLRRRVVQMAVVSTALVTALAAAHIATSPPRGNDGAMTRTIIRQRVAAGEAVKPEPPRSNEALTPGQMLTTAVGYQGEMDAQLEHAETLRIGAYRAKDIIRMNFIDTKLNEMKEIASISRPALAAMQAPGIDLFTMNVKFSIVQQGHDRMKQLMAEIEAATGDTMDPTSIGLAAGGDPDPSNAVNDSTQPASPGNDLDRPGEASPFR